MMFTKSSSPPQYKANPFQRCLLHSPGTATLLSLFVIFSAIYYVTVINLKITLASSTWYDLSNYITLRQFAHELIVVEWEEFMIKRKDVQDDDVVKERSTVLDYLFLVYESKNDSESLISDDKLKIIHNIERRILDVNGFDEWCYLPNSGNPDPALASRCAEFFSVVQPGLPGSFVSANGEIMSADNQIATIESAWCDPTSNRTPLSIFLVDTEFTCAQPFAKVIKSRLPFGGPLKGYTSLTDRLPGQYRDLGNEFILSPLVPFIKDQVDYADQHGITMYFGGLNPLGGVAYGSILSYLFADSIFAAGAMLFVLFFLYFNLGSFFLAVFGFFQIVVSVPLSFTFFSFLGFRYVSFLQFLGIFIIVGIGADDIFVFMDAYLQSKRKPFLKSEEQRLVYAYNRSALAMAVTSSTSSISFFSTAISPIPAISAFGITMGFMVIINFILVITIFPAVVLFNERHVDKMCLCSPLNLFSWIAKKRKLAHVTDINANEDDPKALASPEQKGKRLETFFETTFMGWLSNTCSRRTILAFFVVVIAVALGIASLIEVTGDIPSNFKESHPFNMFRTLVINRFPNGESIPKIPLSVFFGINSDKPANRVNLDPQADEVATSANFDDTFDLTIHQNQLGILKLCNDIANREDLVFERQVFCFISDFKDYLTLNGKDFNDGTHGSEILSEGYLDFQQQQFLAKFSAGGSNTGVFISGADRSAYSAITSTSSTLDLNAYAFITFNTTLPLRLNHLNLKQLRGKLEDYESIIDAHNAEFPSATGMQYCRFWYFLIAGEAIITYSMIGVGLSLGFAGIVLLIANKNWIIASLAMVTICGILSFVAAGMVLLGWSVDFLGSICLIVVIGLSVDYSVHLCHSYVESPKFTRIDRTRESASDMGVSIVNGSVTSFGAGVFLLPCTMTFFNQFGTFMCASIGFSLVFSLFLFLSLCVEIERNASTNGRSTGDVKGCGKRVTNPNLNSEHGGEMQSSGVKGDVETDSRD